MRGKEELLVRVNNDLLKQSVDVDKDISETLIQKSYSLSGKHSLLLSQRMRKVLFETTGSHIMPASPCDRELEKDLSKTAFLISGYAKYERPYVWLRSNHQRFLSISTAAGYQPPKADDPLKLDSIMSWKENDHVKVWHIVDEILQLALSSSSGNKNSFSVNHEYFNTLTLALSVVQTAAMIDFLKKLLSIEYAPSYKEQGKYFHLLSVYVHQIVKHHFTI